MNPSTAKTLLLFTCAFATLFLANQSRGDTILASKHDLSVAGPGTIKASTETEVCIFCHTPHQPPAIGRCGTIAMSTAVYTPYASSTPKPPSASPPALPSSA